MPVARASAKKEARARAVALLDRIEARLEEYRTFLAQLHTIEERRRKPLSAGTVDVYVRTVARMLREERVAAEDDGLSFDAHAWLATQVTPRTPRGTATSILPAVRHFIDWAVSQRLLPSEVLAGVYPYVGGLPDGTREALDEEDYERFVELIAKSSVREPSRTILLLLPECGLRIEEVCTLEIAHLEVKGRAKSRRLGFSVLGKGSVVRWVPLTAEAVRLLDVLRPDLELTLAKGPADERAGPLFASPRGGAIKPNTVRKHLRAERETWNELEDVAPHILRHTFATRLVRKNVPLSVIQHSLGHKSSKTTDRYIQPSVQDYADAIDKLK